SSTAWVDLPLPSIPSNVTNTSGRIRTPPGERTRVRGVVVRPHHRLALAHGDDHRLCGRGARARGARDDRGRRSRQIGRAPGAGRGGREGGRCASDSEGDAARRTEARARADRRPRPQRQRRLRRRWSGGRPADRARLPDHGGWKRGAPVERVSHARHVSAGAPPPGPPPPPPPARRPRPPPPPPPRPPPPPPPL